MKIVLYFNGRLESSVILKWLLLQGHEVIAYIPNLGQKEELSLVRDLALEIGAQKADMEDIQVEFIEKFIFKALKAHALYDGRMLIGNFLIRAFLAQKLIEAAVREGATGIADCAVETRDSAMDFELAAKDFSPHIEIKSPWRDALFASEFKEKRDYVAFAKKYSLKISMQSQNPYSIDANIMQATYGGGDLENPDTEAPAEIFEWTTSPLDAPDMPQTITLNFTKGMPVSVYHHEKKQTIKGSLPLFTYLNALGAENGIGRIDAFEPIGNGAKVRRIYEAPAIYILWKAHLDLENLMLEREPLRLQEGRGLQIKELLFQGYFFSSEMEYLLQSVELAEAKVEGEISLQLYKGNVLVQNRKISRSLYQDPLLKAKMEGTLKRSLNLYFLLNRL